jgi:transcriptional regulator with XRE-family HTH domain
MTASLNPGRLLRAARRRAGLSQRELARRAGTAQSVVARIERGQTSPAAETLDRLLHAAGFRLSVELVARTEPASHMLADVPRILSLTPEERLREVANASSFFAAARRA